jgi:hypothetical protein
MTKVFAGKVRKTGFFQKAGFPGDSDRIFGIYYIDREGVARPQLSGVNLPRSAETGSLETVVALHTSSRFSVEFAISAPTNFKGRPVMGGVTSARPQLWEFEVSIGNVLLTTPFQEVQAP